MKTLEKNLWKWLRDGSRGLPSLHMERVENSLGSGFPDVDGQLGAEAFKIELKSAARPKRPATPVRFKFQAGQSRWLRRRYIVGGRTWLLLQVGSGHDARRYLVRGYRAPEVEDGVTEETLSAWSRVMATADAADIIQAAAFGQR